MISTRLFALSVAVFVSASIVRADRRTVESAGPGIEETTPVSGFVDIATGNPAPKDSEVHLRHDGEWLYLEFHAKETDTASLKMDVVERDGPVWEDDSIELFLDPGRSEKEYWHIMINPAGTVFDEHVKDGRRDPSRDLRGLRATVLFRNDAWIVSMYIPISELADKPPAAGDRWGVNFTRNIPTGGDVIYTTWQPLTGGSFHAPASFADLHFRDAEGQ